MPLASPVIDDRRYQQLVDDTLARVPVHTPEWTNFNQSDPGVTLVQLFAFLTESLLYRANLIPERNRVKFLQLLGVPLAPAAGALGLVSISNERGVLETLVLPADMEVRAGTVPFRTQLGMAVLPVEARVYFKRRLSPPPEELLDYYRVLYASYQTDFPLDVSLYETVALDPKVIDSVELNAETTDQAVWIALLARRQDAVTGSPDELKAVRDQLGGRTLTLGVVPAVDAASLQLTPGGRSQAGSLLNFELPRIAADGRIARDANGRPSPTYRKLTPRTEVDLLAEPGVVQLTLPSSAELDTWRDLDPLETGVGDLPPTIEDSALAQRVITWLRVSTAGVAQARLKWLGINTTPVRQLEHITAEPLSDGDGSPDQVRRLTHAPVLAGSVEVITRTGADTPLLWREIDDLYAAPPEIPARDPRLAPGVIAPPPPPPEAANVFGADHEAGVLTFGDGLHGRRLPLEARVFASYDFCQGSAGNVGERAISSAPLLPSGFTVTNPVRTWGGADAEQTVDGEKQVKRYLQHRDRLVSAEDFRAIAWRAPGVQIGRIEVLPAWHPDFDPIEPGGVPGVVTVLAIPRFDAEQPDAPRADRLFLNTLCRYLDPRRLVTTELVVRGAVYKGVWISVGVEVGAGFSIAEVVENVASRLRTFLRAVGDIGYDAQSTPLFTPPASDSAAGWRLRRPVNSRELLAEAARVDGVTSVADVLLAEGTRPASDTVEMNGLELPRVLGISVVAGEAIPIDALRGGGTTPTSTPTRVLPVPVVPETC